MKSQGLTEEVVSELTLEGGEGQTHAGSECCSRQRTPSMQRPWGRVIAWCVGEHVLEQ